MLCLCSAAQTYLGAASGRHLEAQRPAVELPGLELLIQKAQHLSLGSWYEELDPHLRDHQLAPAPTGQDSTTSAGARRRLRRAMGRGSAMAMTERLPLWCARTTTRASPVATRTIIVVAVAGKAPHHSPAVPRAPSSAPGCACNSLSASRRRSSLARRRCAGASRSRKIAAPLSRPCGPHPGARDGPSPLTST